MRNWWSRLSNPIQAAVFFMVAALFTTWFLFGSITVNHQNEAILQGVHVDVRKALAQSEENLVTIVNNQQLLLSEGKYVTCILKIQPENRTVRKVKRCARHSGFDQLV